MPQEGQPAIGHQMVGRPNWMSPPETIPAIVLSKFSAALQCVRVFARRLSRCFRPCFVLSFLMYTGGVFALRAPCALFL